MIKKTKKITAKKTTVKTVADRTPKKKVEPAKKPLKNLQVLVESVKATSTSRRKTKSERRHGVLSPVYDRLLGRGIVIERRQRGDRRVH